MVLMIHIVTLISRSIGVEAIHCHKGKLSRKLTGYNQRIPQVLGANSEEEGFMQRKLGRSLFGFKPSEVISQMEDMNNVYQKKLAELQAEIENARADLDKSRKQVAEIQQKLDVYIAKERLVSEVMITAQQNAQKIEEQAREKARILLENSEAELKRKQQELDFLRIKVARFKEDFRETLENYRISLENVKEDPDEVTFTPTLITNESKSGEKDDVVSKKL